MSGLKSWTASHRHSRSSSETSPTQSCSSSPEPSHASSTAPSIYTADTAYTASAAGERPSVLSRLRSSISTTTSLPIHSKVSVEPSHFLIPPEQPENRFVDSIGIVCPGVSDRPQCASPLAHFVSTFRVCQPIEYTTALADHGLTYTDYCRLRLALKTFLASQDLESKLRSSQETLSHLPEDLQTKTQPAKKKMTTCRPRSTFLDTTEQLAKSRRQAIALNQMLEEITANVRTRGSPVVVCVSSFSVFAPYRISEAHIQILHAPLAPQHLSIEPRPDGRLEQRLSFIDPYRVALVDTRSVSRSRPKLDRSASDMTKHTQCPKFQHETSQTRDRSRPWPLWPNAIPSSKRQIMSENEDRYGVDPYFRAWLRAGINSRTKSRTYTKYMIEQEDDPFVNRRLQYTDTSSRGALLLDILKHGMKVWQEQFPSTVNRVKYEHNRRLECRRTTEHGSRLRVVRFGFRHPLFPPHTPEMEELGLSKTAYPTITSTIANMHAEPAVPTKSPVSYVLSSLNEVRHRSIEDALMRASEYIRELNASQRCVVWTIENISGVYDRGLARNRTEWEISAWNSEDPLELLIELERWGVIEKQLDVEDEE